MGRRRPTSLGIEESDMNQWSVHDLTPHFGAEIEGITLQTPLADEDAQQLRDLFDDRGLLVFRDVEIDTTLQERLTYSMIGREAPGPSGEAEGTPRKETFISNKEAGGIAPFGRLLWHSDAMWSEQPFQALSLYGVDVAQPSVPTLFASTQSAWDELPDELRARADELHALHITGQVDRGRYADGEVLKPIRTQEQTTTTRIVARHPRTGRSMLYVCEQCTREVCELPPDESEALLEELFAYLYDPEHTLEHHWRQGDLVVWDNLAVQHGRPDVHTEGPARTLRKIFAPKMQVAVAPETPRFSRAN
jgi:alpha-ketoglutarate-dependent taurine dioxygenase